MRQKNQESSAIIIIEKAKYIKAGSSLKIYENQMYAYISRKLSESSQGRAPRMVYPVTEKRSAAKFI